MHNAHVIIEEKNNKTKKQQPVGADETMYCLFIATVIRKILNKETTVCWCR